MELNLRGRKVLITGGSKGIGAAAARWFAREGCDLVLAARSADTLAATAEAIRAASQVNVQTVAADLADPAARARLAAAAPDIDILVNNAGAIPGGTIDQVEDEEWRSAWDLKVFGYINLTRTYNARMKERGRGVIINIIGVKGDRLDHGYIAGSTGNAALIAFTRTLGSQSLEYGVRVVGVNPGPVETDRIVVLAKRRALNQFGDESRYLESYGRMPMGRPAKPDEIAAMVVFLASDLSSYTSGTVINVDGGAAHRDS